MDDFLNAVYNTHNRAAAQAILAVSEKVAEDYGDEGVVAFEQFVQGIPAEEVYELGDAEKIASEAGIDMDKVAELDAQGRIFAHALMDELEKRANVEQHVFDTVLGAFVDAIEG